MSSRAFWGQMLQFLPCFLVQKSLLKLGSAISNGREPKSCLGRVFNSKLGRTAILCGKCMVWYAATSRAENRPRVRPASLMLLRQSQCLAAACGALYTVQNFWTWVSSLLKLTYMALTDLSHYIMPVKYRKIGNLECQIKTYFKSQPTCVGLEKIFDLIRILP